ncbi:type IV secretory system conjugative DNA transfer family protein [Nonomuraea sp. NPDC050547]|uniref:type IV secretory system conjugative DNA transfer family protein n=1 Tax=Nonomuraea sp. NPDC050547 TaxID=3364368 RepID=UPI0037A73FDA
MTHQDLPGVVETVAPPCAPAIAPSPMRAALASPAALAAEANLPMPWDIVPGFWGWVVVLVVLALGTRSARRVFAPAKPVLPLRYRLRMGWHPGPGWAGLWELYRGYGRGPARKAAKRARPSLGWKHRWFGQPSEYAIGLGRALPLWRRAYASFKHVELTVAPPQQGKSAAAAARIIRAPGPVLATSVRGDLIAGTAGVRQQYGTLHVFNPAGVGDYGSTFKWNLVAGCQDAEIAMLRAGYLVAGVNAKLDDSSFWSDQAVLTLAGYLQAGALVRVTLRTVLKWIITREETPLRVLERHEGAYEASVLAVGEYITLPERTQASVATTVRNVLKFMAHPGVADALEPRTERDLFDIEQFLTTRDTLYLVADPGSRELAPLFLCLTSEIFFRAVKEGSRGTSQALDPPLSMVLDEVANFCPIPVQAWASYSAGSGVIMNLLVQAWSQLKERYGHDGADTIFNLATCKVVYTATTDEEILKKICSLLGRRRMRVGSESVADGTDSQGRSRSRRRPTYDDVDILTPEDVRRLPPWHAVVVLGDRKPTIVKVDRVWKLAEYRKWAKSGMGIQLPSVTPRPVPIPRPELLHEVDSVPAFDELTPRRERRQTAPPSPLRQVQAAGTPPPPLRLEDLQGATEEMPQAKRWSPWDEDERQQ